MPENIELQREWSVACRYHLSKVYLSIAVKWLIIVKIGTYDIISGKQYFFCRNIVQATGSRPLILTIHINAITIYLFGLAKSGHYFASATRCGKRHRAILFIILISFHSAVKNHPVKLSLILSHPLFRLWLVQA